MRQGKPTSGERIVKDIKRQTRKQYSAEEKIRIVLDGLRGVKMHHPHSRLDTAFPTLSP